MKKSFVEYIIEKKVFVIIIIVLLMLSGLLSYINMPKQNFPEVVLPVAAVTAVYPGASTEDMEELVTKKVEETVMSLNGFDSCTSDIHENYSTVLVSLDMKLNQDEVDKSFDDLRLKINSLKESLPPGVTQVSVNTDIMNTAGMLLAISSDKATGDELYQRANELKDKIKPLDGIKKVDLYGQQLSDIKVTVDMNKLNALNLSMSDISSIISAQNSMIPTGTIDIGKNTLSVNSNGKFENIDDIRNLIVGASKTSGVLYRLSDIATIEKEVPKASKYYYDGKSSILLAVYFDKGINVVTMSDSLKSTVKNFSNTLSGSEQVHEIYLQSDVVQKAIDGFLENLMEAIFLVMIVVLVCINLRTSLVVSIAIPLSILSTLIILPLFHVNIEFVSLAALIIVLGMLVDNSIVVSESIQTKLDEGQESLDAAVNGTKIVARPVLISMLVAIAGFTSLLTLTGAYKQLAFSLPVVIISCLLICSTVSLLVTPLMSYIFLRKRGKEKEGNFKKLERLYDKYFQIVFQNRKAAIAISLIFLLLCASSLTAIKLETVAKVNKDVITIEVKGDNENNKDKTEKVVQEIQNILKEQPEVTYYLSGVGEGIPRYDYSVLPKGVGSNVGDVFVRINLEKGSRFKQTKDMVAYLQKEFDENVSGGQVIVDELGIMAMISKPIEYKLYSDNLEDLNSASDLVAEEMREMKGTKNIINAHDILTHQYYVDMDAKKMNSLGLTKVEVQNQLSLALLGRDVSLYRESSKEYNVLLDSNIDSQSMLENYKIKSSVTGNKYLLQQFATIEAKPQLTEITRIDGKRGKTVSCYSDGSYSNIELQTQLEKRVDKLNLPASVTVEKSGEKKDFMDLLQSIAMAAVFSLILIFLILVFQFNSIKKALISLVSVPFGACAGFAGLLLTRQNLSFFALLGVLSLLGVVLANAVILIQFIDDERAKGASVLEACKSAGTKRLRAILTSTATATLGLLPLAVGGDLLFVPMARLLMFGLITSMIINLIFVPIIYYMVFNEEKKETSFVDETI